MRAFCPPGKTCVQKKFDPSKKVLTGSVTSYSIEHWLGLGLGLGLVRPEQEGADGLGDHALHRTPTLTLTLTLTRTPT